jgi:hypothetical protein
MNIVEMIRQGQINGPLLLIVVQAVFLGGLCLILAKSKNRNYKVAFLAGAIPFFNYLSVLYYIGVPKLDD